MSITARLRFWVVFATVGYGHSEAVPLEIDAG